jgi:hypothetical protein
MDVLLSYVLAYAEREHTRARDRDNEREAERDRGGGGREARLKCLYCCVPEGMTSAAREQVRLPFHNWRSLLHQNGRISLKRPSK